MVTLLATKILNVENVYIIGIGSKFANSSSLLGT
jgi:hypothetical protein